LYYVVLDDWLTVHRSITLGNFQLHAQNSLFIYNKFIKILYMFRAVRRSSSGGLIVSMQHLILSLKPQDRLSQLTDPYEIAKFN